MSDQTRRAVLSSASVVGGIALAGCAGDDSGGDDGSTVEMTDDLVFDPETVEVEQGATVTWENTGSVGHTVTAYDDELPDGADYFASGGADSETAARDAYTADRTGDVPGGETFEHTFETTGEYEYFCIPHEGGGMTGTVVVE